MKIIYLFLMGMMTLIVSTQAQNLTGKVVDEKNTPLAYANVILQTADSIYLVLVSAKPFSLFKKIKGRFPFGDSDLFRYFVLAKELYNDEQKYTFYRTADVRPTTFFT